MNKKWFVLTILLSLIAATENISAQNAFEPKDVNDLLKLSLASYESLPPYAMHVETELTFTEPNRLVDGETYVAEKRYDNGRLDVDYLRYEIRGDEKKLVYDKRGIWTGQQFQWRQQYIGDLAQDQQIIAACSFVDAEAKSLLVSPYSGSFISGFLAGDTEHVCKILKQSGVAKLHDKTEAIDDNTCYIVEGKTQSENYKIWIDPNNGFNVRKAVVNKKYNNQPINTENSRKKFLMGLEVIISDVEIEKVGEHYIPISAKLNRSYKYSDGTTQTDSLTSKRSKIQLNPNFEEMGAFVMDGIPEGTRVINIDKPGFIFIWHDGKVTPINIQPLPLTGKQLPELKELETESSPDMIDKIVLVCFFDYEQRPSRNCIIQLSKSAQELQTKDIVIFAVQASKVEKVKLDEWIKESNISLPVGMIVSDEEKTRINWGIKSLPWLILTDENHIVTAEGFSINEVGEKLQ
jgi:hypothetical protein